MQENMEHLQIRHPHLPALPPAGTACALIVMTPADCANILSLRAFLLLAVGFLDLTQARLPNRVVSQVTGETEPRQDRGKPKQERGTVVSPHALRTHASPQNPSTARRHEMSEGERFGKGGSRKQVFTTSQEESVHTGGA